MKDSAKASLWEAPATHRLGLAGSMPAERCRSGEAAGYVESHSHPGEGAPSVSIATTIVDREVRSTNRIHLRSAPPIL
jgi:hypothetical protein